MIVLTRWAIRRKSDGFYIPQPKGRNGRGGSMMEPQDPTNLKTEVRLFNTPKGANNALIAWLKGEWSKTFISSGFLDDEREESVSIKPKPERKRDDMQVVPVQIILNSDGKRT